MILVGQLLNSLSDNNDQEYTKEKYSSASLSKNKSFMKKKDFDYSSKDFMKTPSKGNLSNRKRSDSGK